MTNRKADSNDPKQPTKLTQQMKAQLSTAEGLDDQSDDDDNESQQPQYTFYVPDVESQSDDADLYKNDPEYDDDDDDCGQEGEDEENSLNGEVGSPADGRTVLSDCTETYAEQSDKSDGEKSSDTINQ